MQISKVHVPFRENGTSKGEVALDTGVGMARKVYA